MANADWVPTALTKWDSYECTAEYLFENFMVGLVKQTVSEGTPPPAVLGDSGYTDPSEFIKRMLKFAHKWELKPILVGGTSSPGLLKGKIPSDGVDYTALYTNNDSALYLNVDSTSGFSFVTTDPKALKAMLTLQKDVYRASEKPVIHIMVSKSSGLDTQPVELGISPLERDNYSEAVLAGYDRTVSALQAKSPFGRLVILDGPQGTGKSYMVRAFIHDTPPDKAFFVFVPANMVSSLGGPDLANLLLRLRQENECKILILVVEDADMALVRRDGTNEAEVSTLLNLTDGILGEILDVRVICTTNRKLEEVDKAIKRKGRLLCHSHLGSLTQEHALRVYERVAKKPAPKNSIKESMFLGDIYALALDPANPATEDKSEDDRQFGFKGPSGR